MTQSPTFGNKGLSLIELLIAMTIGVVLTFSVSQFYLSQRKANDVQGQITEMQQNVRMGMETMVRDLQLAGYDPTGGVATSLQDINGVFINSFIQTADASTVGFIKDLSGDGDTSDANENVTYMLFTSSAIQCLGRVTGSTSMEPVAQHIEALAFRYFRFGDPNTPMTMPVTSVADRNAIKIVEITLRGRTAKPDPDWSQNGGYRTYTLTSQVMLRNR